MTDLTEFLLARIAEDEGDAGRAQAEDDGDLWVVTGSDRPVGVDYNPARVLADCQAKRAIIGLHRLDADMRPWPSCTTCADWEEAGYEGPPPLKWPCSTLLALAQPYRSHPGFDRAWTT